MKRVIVIGCPGSGKSTFARALHGVVGLPLYHLDMMYWNADRTKVPKQVFLERLHSAMENEAWIIDGNYGSTMEQRLQACDTVFFLDYPAEVCLGGIEARRGKVRSDMPWVENVGEVDVNFIEFIRAYNTVSRPVVVNLLEKYCDKVIYIFKSREEAAEFLEGI